MNAGRKALGWVGAGLAMLTAGCAFDALLAATASLGGATAGQRGNAQVVFINNTPFRAIFTFGAYDHLDRDTQPVLRQFSSATTTLSLEGNSESTVQQIQCHRVFSIGGAGLIARVRDNLSEGSFEETPLVEGVYFSSADVGDDLADLPTEGVAAPLDSFIGADFECGSMVIYRFEVDDSGAAAFTVEMTTIPAESTR